jgi:hypothetical protein
MHDATANRQQNAWRCNLVMAKHRLHQTGRKTRATTTLQRPNSWQCVKIVCPMKKSREMELVGLPPCLGLAVGVCYFLWVLNSINQSLN